MIEAEVKCHYLNKCYSAGTKKCKDCKHNERRNYVVDYYEKAKDKQMPDQCPKLTYDGPAEQTAGYRCPVCGGFTNPYQLAPGNCCSHCGYRLNI